MEAQRRKEEEEERKRRELDKAKQVRFSWTLLGFSRLLLFTPLDLFISFLSFNGVMIAASSGADIREKFLGGLRGHSPPGNFEI